MTKPIHVFLIALVLGWAAAMGAAPWQPGGADGSDPGAPDGSIPVGALDYGFGLQLDNPYQAPGGTARATLFFFNMTPYYTQGAYADLGGLGCRYDLFIRDQRGRLVWRPRVPCPLADPETGAPAGPFPFPGGTLLRYPVDLSMEYWNAETGDPDGTPLPGGPYLLQAQHDFHGPSLLTPEGSPDVYGGPGGDPAAEVPFRVAVCDRCGGRCGGPVPMRELGSGKTSGYRLGDPDFHGDELVLRSEGAALEFWREHTSILDSPPQPPFVDFDTEMVIVTVMGPTPGGGTTRIIGADQQACHIMVQVMRAWNPGPPSALTNPFHAVAVPRSLKEVLFIHAVTQ